MSDAKAHLHGYLKTAREAVLWKLEGLSEYDVRRPMTRTGTNLLGLVKHLASVEAGYFGATFDRPFPEPIPWWTDDAEPNADMWATGEESRSGLIGLYERAAAHADATIEALQLDDLGRVSWWDEDHAQVTLHQVLVHVVAETNRHAGHADVVRELLDGSAGWRATNAGLPEQDETWWEQYRARLEQVAAEATG